MDPTKKYKLILILGQSNAVGTTTDVALLTGAYADYWRETNIRISKQMSCYNDSDPGAVCSVEYATHKVGKRKHPQGTFGPELGIARALPNLETHVANPGNVIFVKCATGGTDLDVAWDPDALTGFMLYQKMMAWVQNPRQLWAASYEVVGVVWIQGENDSRFLGKANAYEANLAAFAARLRLDFSNATMPIVVTQLHAALDIVYGPYRDTIRAAEQAVAAADANMTLVSHDAVPLRVSDNVHLTENGLCAHGLDLGAALDAMIPACG